MPFNSDNNIGKISFSQEQLKNFFVEKLDLEDSPLFKDIDVEKVDFQELYDVVMSSGIVSDEKMQELNDEIAVYSESTDSETQIDGIRDEYLIEQLSKSMDLDGDGILSSDEFSSLYKKVNNSAQISFDYNTSALEKALGEIGIKFDKFNLGGLKFLQNQFAKLQDNMMPNDSSTSMDIGDFFSVDDIKNVSQTLTASEALSSLAPDMPVGDTGKTVGDIQNEILSKQAQITTLNQSTNAAIMSQQGVYDEALASQQENIKIFADAKAQYEYQSQSLDMQIEEQDTEITDQKGVIKDQEGIISEKESAIDDAESNIEDLEKQKDSTLNPIQRAKLEEQIKQLEDKIVELEDDIKEAEEKKSEAEDALNAAEKAKADYEAQQISLDSEFASNYSDEKLSAILTPINKVMSDAMANIENLESTRETELATIQAEISVLQLQLEGVEVAEQVKTDLGNNDIFQYNEEAGRKLAESAIESVDEETGHMGAVNSALEQNYGTSLASLNNPLEIKEALRGNTKGYESIAQQFKEVSITKDELSNLPMGAIVVWDNGESVDNKSATSAEDLNEHVMMSLGDGKSPEMQEDAEYTVFIPV